MDRVTLHAMGGNGDNGVASIKREKFKSLAGPDGGDGGNGDSVILEASKQETTFLNYHRSPYRHANDGMPGTGDFRQGETGANITLPAPEGTVAKLVPDELLTDLTGAGVRYMVAEGSHGGLGNAALASKVRKAPGFALLGGPGEERDVIFELKSVASVTLVGPSSTSGSPLIATLSPTRPEIADYPFTTLISNLGVTSAGDTYYTVADIPDLIPDASQGRSLDFDFLRHIERHAVIVHMLDTAAFETNREPVEDLRIIETGLEAYQDDLTQVEDYVPVMERPRVIILNKIDIPDGRDLAEVTCLDLESFDWPALEVSAVSHEDLKELSFALAGTVEAERAKRPALEAAHPVIRPKTAGRSVETTVRKTCKDGEEVFQVRGDKPERWMRQTDLVNDEAMSYLADHLNVAGVEDELMKAGVVAGDIVVIGGLDGGVVFDWEPILTTKPELLDLRGTDLRLDQNARPSREEHREIYRQVVGAKTAACGELRTERQAGRWTGVSDQS